MRAKFRGRKYFKGPVYFGQSAVPVPLDLDVTTFDVDLYGTNPLVNFTRNLASASTNAPVVTIKQDHATDDQVALKLEQDATTVPALEVDGWSKLGWSTSDPSGAVTSGSVRVISVSSKYWLAIAVGNSAYRFVELTLTSTA